MKKKFIVILLSGLFFLSGCAGQTSSPDGARKETSRRGDSVIEFWTTYNTEKILSDYDASNYSKIKQEAAVKVETAKNEEECAQLIMTAKTDISYYDVKLSDLKCGDSVYDKSNVSVYNQKYIAVDEIQNGQGATLPTGNYPDALLPFDVAKKYGENNVKAGKNQGITFVFDIPADTKAGVYTGAFTISYDDKTENIPVEMKVRDVTVSETTHSKTYFGVSATGSLPYGELDSDPALKNLYNEELSKYRLCGGTWYVGSDDPDDWVDLVWNFVCDPKNSTLAVPWKYVQSGAGDTIDETYTRDCLIAFGKKCLKEGVNLVGKLVAYYAVIDEPDMGENQYAHTKFVMDNVNNQHEEAAQAIENSSGDAALKAEIAKSIRDIEILLTVGSYLDEYSDIVDTWCPKTSNYDVASTRERFMQGDGVKWWYTCSGPMYPYASYMIEAAGYFPRLMDWQAEKYGVTGNLYWDVCYYQNADGSHVEDCFQYPDRCTVNGDGFLFYPAKSYGMDTPIGSIRIQSARDGIEDKEILLAIRNGYSEAGKACGYEINADAILNNYYDKLFDGVKVLTSSERFYSVRSNILDLAEMFESEYKFMVSDIKMVGNDVSFEIVTAADCTLKNGKNQTYTPSAQYGTGENAVKVYKITVSKLDSGTLDLTVSNKNGNKTISLPLGGKAITTSAQAISAGVEVFYGNTSVQGEKLIISFNSSEANKTQRFTMSGNYVSTINERTDWLTIRAKGASGVKYSVCFEYEVMSSYYEVASGYFTGAIDSINVKNIHSLSWNSGKIKKIHVYIGEKGDGARSVEIYDMTVAVLG